MALRTEAPSTGSQREPSRLEQNTNQRLTGHSHSPHQRDGRTPAQSTHIPVPRFTSYSQGWMNALILAATQEKLAQAGTGKLKMRGPLNECVCVCFLCVCVPPVLSVSFSRYTMSGWWETGCKPGAESKPVGLECDCHACKCIKISEQSAKY